MRGRMQISAANNKAVDCGSEMSLQLHFLTEISRPPPPGCNLRRTDVFHGVVAFMSPSHCYSQSKILRELSQPSGNQRSGMSVHLFS